MMMDAPPVGMEDEDAAGLEGNMDDRALLTGLYGNNEATLVHNRGIASSMMRDLALDVVEEYLGPVVAGVAEILAKFGELDLRKIEMHAKKLAMSVDTVDQEAQCGRAPKPFKYLTRSSIKSALVNLLRHNVVLMDTTELLSDLVPGTKPRKLRPQKATYRFCSQRALMLLRHPKICSIIEKRAGAVHSIVVEEVLISGANSKRSILDSVAVRVASAKDTFAVAAFASDFESRPDIPADWLAEMVDMSTSISDILMRPEAVAARHIAEKAFNELVDRRILIPQKKFSVKTEEEEKELEDEKKNEKRKKIAVKIDPKKAKRTKGDADRRLSPSNAAGSGAKRKIQDEDALATVLISNQPPAKKAKGGPVELARLIQQKKKDEEMEAAILAKKKKKKKKSRLEDEKAIELVDQTAVVEIDAPVITQVNEYDVEEFGRGDPRGALWFKFNMNYFLQCFRAELIVDHFADRAEEPFFGEVLSVVMHSNINKNIAGRVDEDVFDLPSTTHVPVSSESLLKELYDTDGLNMLSEHGNEIDRREALSRVLDVLQSISNGIVLVDDYGTHRTVNLNFENAVRVLKRRCFLKQIESEHGVEGMRVINLLLDKKGLEESQVGDLALLAPPRARTVLQELLKEGYLHMEEVSKRPDLNPAYTYYVYRAIDSHIEQAIAASTMKALLNLRIRLRLQNMECKRYEEVAIQVERYKENQITRHDLRKVQGFEQFTRIRFNVDNLERAILNLDRTCLLLASLSDFEG